VAVCSALVELCAASIASNINYQRSPSMEITIKLQLGFSSVRINIAKKRVFQGFINTAALISDELCKSEATENNNRMLASSLWLPALCS